MHIGIVPGSVIAGFPIAGALRVHNPRFHGSLRSLKRPFNGKTGTCPYSFLYQNGLYRNDCLI